MNRKKRRRIVATALAALSLVAFFWLSTLDVYVDERNTDGVPAFCGSAYDVALLKGDGFMGGEVPPNQAAIDRACVAEARTDVVLAGIAGVAGLAAAAYAVLLPRRTRSRQDSGRPSYSTRTAACEDVTTAVLRCVSRGAVWRALDGDE